MDRRRDDCQKITLLISFLYRHRRTGGPTNVMIGVELSMNIRLVYVIFGSLLFQFRLPFSYKIASRFASAAVHRIAIDITFLKSAVRLAHLTVSASKRYAAAVMI